MRRSVVAGVGHYLPERIVTNADLAKQIDTSDEWIVERTGIHQRYMAAEGQYTSDLALKAAQRALEHARRSGGSHLLRGVDKGLLHVVRCLG